MELRSKHSRIPDTFIDRQALCVELGLSWLIRVSVGSKFNHLSWVFNVGRGSWRYLPCIIPFPASSKQLHWESWVTPFLVWGSNLLQDVGIADPHPQKYCPIFKCLHPSSILLLQISARFLKIYATKFYIFGFDIYWMHYLAYLRGMYFLFDSCLLQIQTTNTQIHHCFG